MWGIHVAVFADKVGLRSDQLASLANGDASDECWPDPSDRAVLRAVDEMHATNDLSDAAWCELVTAIGEDGSVETALLCGWYHAISYVTRALRLPLEPGTAPIPG